MRTFAVAILAAIFVLLSIAASASDLRLATWNVQTLATPGRKVFPDSYTRTPDDYRDLSHYRGYVAADVFALQEISSPAALRLVFPADEYDLCISGQFFDAQEHRDEGAASARCYGAADEAPDAPQDASLGLFLAFAIRRESGWTVAELRDEPALGVAHTSADGRARPVRWGLELLLHKEGHGSLRLLNVHLKSGCPDDHPSPDSWDPDCRTLERQYEPLRAWLARATAAPEPFVLLGDLNRRLDLDEHDELLAVLENKDDGSRENDLELYRYPFKEPSICWKDTPSRRHLIAIDYFLTPREHNPVVPWSHREYPYSRRYEQDARRLTDHCARTIELRLRGRPRVNPGRVGDERVIE